MYMFYFGVTVINTVKSMQKQLFIVHKPQKYDYVRKTTQHAHTNQKIFPHPSHFTGRKSTK